MTRKEKKNKMWGGRFRSDQDKLMKDINSSISFDIRLYEEDIKASIAHARMLAKKNIITKKDSQKIISGLNKIKNEFINGTFKLNTDLEDIHMNIEANLEKKIGTVAKKLHTGRSRNDQVATDMRLYMRKNCLTIIKQIQSLQLQLAKKALKHFSLIMPGFTHMQIAQPITLGHHLLAYVEMFERDKNRFKDALKRINENPLGAAALAGTSFPIDRNMTTKELGFKKPMENSIDAVSARDFIIEPLAASSILATHLSRFSEEIVLWVSEGFNFIDLPDSLATGSSIMPQKRNPDIAELVRGKNGRIIGSLMSILVVMKGLPLAYSKDLQEDKELTFDAIDNIIISLKSIEAITKALKPKADNLKKAAGRSYSTSTDLADWLVKNIDMPFRQAHQVTGKIVKYCEKKKISLWDIEFAELKRFNKKITKDIYSVLNVEKSVNQKKSSGSTAPLMVKGAATKWVKKLQNEKN
ncbi:MAG: argininosuccinate lyase [Pseudomonadota bacterium]|nr:argininosuccinate lyase [Pseudomonadota bacterium]MEC9382470.1 argininosuccinate lyase [Pseudomonadota bacterium]